jgi:two-component system sensor histidine kinase CpxA
MIRASHALFAPSVAWDTPWEKHHTHEIQTFPFAAVENVDLAVAASGLAGVSGHFARRVAFSSGLDVLLRGSAGDRLRASGEQIGSQLRELPRSQWEPVMKAFAEEHGVACDIWMPHGDWATHTISEAPEEVKERLNRDRPPPPPQRPQHYESDRRPPPPDRPGPPGENRPPPRDAFVQRDPMGPDDRSRPPRDFEEQPRANEFQPARPIFFLADKKQDAYWAAVYVPLQARSGPDHVVWLIRSESLSANGLLFDITPWVIGAVSLLFFSILFWVPFALSITRYVAKLKQATDHIADGHFDVNLDTRRSDELGSLGAAISGMAARIDHLLKGQKRFLGDVAHELCSPLARLRTGLGILETRLPETEQSRLAAIEEEATELAELIDEILVFSRATAGMQQVRGKEIVLRDLVEEVRAREASGLAIELEIDPALTVLADAKLLKRAIGNVLRNAVRYAGEQAHIRIQAIAEAGTVRLAIIDDGPGVPESEITHLFEPFYRPDTARTRETGGVGLGLTIVRSCVEACGGKVSARNHPPKGFCVEMTLPATSA